MASPLEGSLARIVGKAMAATFLPAVLTKYEPGGGPAYDPLPPVAVPYKCRAIVETYSDFYRLQGLVGQSDLRVLVLAATLKARPAPSDSIAIRGKSYAVSAVETDPAEGVWMLRVTA